MRIPTLRPLLPSIVLLSVAPLAQESARAGRLQLAAPSSPVGLPASASAASSAAGAASLAPGFPRSPQTLSQTGSSELGTKGGEALLAGVGFGSSLNPGGFAVIDQSLFSGTLIATPGTGISGLTATPDGRLWAATRSGFPQGSLLLELDPGTGAVLSSAPILAGGQDVRVSDLATQPGTGTLYASGSFATGAFGALFTIDAPSGAASFVGESGLGWDGGLAFAPDGTLYMISALIAAPQLVTLDPGSAAVLSAVNYGPATGVHGLAVRSDGGMLGCVGGSAGGDNLIVIDPVTGATGSFGASGVGTVSDLAYLPEVCNDLTLDGSWTTLGGTVPVGDFFEGAWCFEAPYPVTLTVTDFAVVSDRFEVYDDGVLVLTTSDVPDWDDLGFASPFDAPPYELDPNLALASGSFSTGTVELGPGAHSLEFRAIHVPPSSIGGPPFTDSTVAFRAEPSCPPSPATPGAPRFGVPPNLGQMFPETQDKMLVGAGLVPGVAPPDVRFFPPNPGATVLLSWSFSLAPTPSLPVPGLGTLLISITPPNPIATVQEPFAVTDTVSAGAIPNECNLIGLALFSQGGYVEVPGGVFLTNAVDYVIGTH